MPANKSRFIFPLLPVRSLFGLLAGGILLSVTLYLSELFINSSSAAETAAHSHESNSNHHSMHAHHHTSQNHDEYMRSEHAYTVPDVSLVNMDGKEISLNNELNSNVPTLLNFIFTSCTAICPVMTSTFSQVQYNLSQYPEAFKMVSISIDPEQDTPETLKKYANKYQAGANWDFLTGNLDAILEIQRAFNAYRGNKMNHVPITFMRATNTDPWVRIEGFTSAKDLVGEYQEIVMR
jgi:protein SCO1/2